MSITAIAWLNTVDRYSLSGTPLGTPLDDATDLVRNKAIMGVQEQGDALIVQARTSANQNHSNIALVFSFSHPRIAAMDGEIQSGRRYHGGVKWRADGCDLG